MELVGRGLFAFRRHRVKFYHGSLEIAYGCVQFCTIFSVSGLENLKLAAHLGHLRHLVVNKGNSQGLSDVKARWDLDYWVWNEDSIQE